MEVSEGQVFRYDNGEFLVARESKTLEHEDDEVSVFWSKTNLQERYDMSRNDLERYTNITEEHHKVPKMTSFQRLEQRLEFRHSTCGHLAVTNSDFIAGAKKLSPRVLVGILRKIAAGAIGGIVELLNTLYSLYKTYDTVKNFSPAEWFNDVGIETTDRYDYKHIGCGEEINFTSP